MNKLKNKVVLITGASAGLGKALAMKLNKLNMKLALVSRNEENLNRIKQELLNKNSKADLEVFMCDVSKPQEVKQTVDEVLSKFGRIDILINNAAIWAEGELEEHLDEQLARLFEVNTLGYMYFTKCVAPIMKKQKQGDIIFINSIAATWEFPADFAPYAASKSALFTFAESLRKEYAKYNIRLMSIYPPGMDTEIFKRAGFDYGIAEWMTKKEYIADIVAYMLQAPRDISLSHVIVNKVGFN